MSLRDSDILKINLGVSGNFEKFLEKFKTLVEISDILKVKKDSWQV